MATATLVAIPLGVTPQDHADHVEGNPKIAALLAIRDGNEDDEDADLAFYNATGAFLLSEQRDNKHWWCSHGGICQLTKGMLPIFEHKNDDNVEQLWKHGSPNPNPNPNPLALTLTLTLTP